MTYIRHRSRMIQASVFQDVQDTLIACRWMVGTTSRPMIAPGSTGPAEPITTSASDIFALAEGFPITLLDYFPEAEGEQGGATAPNTLAMDNGRPGDAVPLELGSTAMEQPYRFNLAIWAVSDAVADAVFADLKDRYEGRILGGPFIALFDFLSGSSDPAAWLEVDTFRYSRNVESATPSDVHLFFAELTLTDIVD